MSTTPSGLIQLNVPANPGFGNPGLEYATPLGLTSETTSSLSKLPT